MKVSSTLRRLTMVGLLGAGAMMAAPPAHAGTYAFHVACPDRILVVEWGVGDINPGREFLRATTGAQHPGCSVTDSDEFRDRGLPRERHSDAGGVIDGVTTWIGKILRFGF